MITVKQEVEHINIAMLCVSELQWTGREYFLSDNHKVFYSGNDNLRRNGMAPILKQNIAQAVRAIIQGLIE